MQAGAAASAALGLVPGAQSGAPGIREPRAGETEYFWYREQPPGKYIDSQRGDKAFAHAGGRVFLSADNGRTWPHSAPFPDASRITFSHILKNGNILFATGSKLYLSTDNLKDYREVIVKTPDGADFVPHTSRNPQLDGWYFHTLPGVVSWDVDGKEMMVWGNYCNVLGGAAPVNIYYSTDSGRTVKIAYSFGQNPFFSDTGSPGEARAARSWAIPTTRPSPVTCTPWRTTRWRRPSTQPRATALADSGTSATGCGEPMTRSGTAGTGT
ncbi:MAG: hypothetical protein IT158_27540 [Bryobacterales bacterium]|nr:hypothetical protein [Bryobacterales bacterium]